MASVQRERTLFNPFRKTEYLQRGGYGHIFRIPDTIVGVKISHRIINGTPEEGKRAAESEEILQRERAVYEALAARPPHPNIVQYFCSTELAIFIRFEPDTMERRLERRQDKPISEQRQFRWIKQVARAASWLEKLDYFHGDMRPANILLEDAEHVKICNFGRAIKRGHEIEVTTYPFYRPARGAAAGSTHEQFAIGSCIYNIRTREVPHGQWETPMYEALVRGEYPPTEGDSILGRVVSSCWNAGYGSMQEVEKAIGLAIGTRTVDDDDLLSLMTPEEYEDCVEMCQGFLKTEQRNTECLVGCYKAQMN